MQHSILLVFAQTPNQNFLYALRNEQSQIQSALQPATESGAVRILSIENSSNAEIAEVLTKYPDQVAIFHFGGHAHEAGLAARDETVIPGGLARLLSLQTNLQLVFLNGCDTQQQVTHFFKQGIPAVLATTCNVADGEAAYFAVRFYQAIAERHSILEAYKVAVSALQQRWQKYGEFTNPQIEVLRSIDPSGIIQSDVPWKLYIHENAEQTLGWRLSYPKSLTRVPAIDLETECLGRNIEMDSLRAMLLELNRATLISGIGGIGKTTLANGYLQKFHDEFDYLIWINSGEDIASAIAMNPELALNLELPFVEGEATEERLVRVLNKLRNLPGKNLLVLDDVSSEVGNLSGLLPGGANWQIILTSRQQTPGFPLFNVGALRPEDALYLFRLHYDEGEGTQAAELLQEINYHTLTIEVMAKTLRRLNGLLSIPELITVLRKRELDDPRLQELVWTRHAGEERAIFFHLMKAFELANLADQEVWLMQQYAVLPSFSMEVKTTALLLYKPALELNKQVNAIFDKGWLSRQDKGFVMHRMVQEVVKYQRPPAEADLMSLMKGIREYVKPERLQEVTVYANSVANWLDDFETLSDETEEWLLFAALQLFGFDYRFTARKLLENSIYRQKAIHGEDHPYVAFKKIYYAQVLSEMGLLDEAEKNAYAAYVCFFVNFDNNDGLIDFAKQTLAMIKLKQGRYDEAFLDLYNIIEREKKRDVSINLIYSFSDYAIARIRAGAFMEGKLVIEKAIEAVNSLGVENNLMVAKLKTNLASAWLGLRKPSQAGWCLDEALPVLLEHLPRGHSFLLHARATKAAQLTHMDEFEDAEALFKELFYEFEMAGFDKPTGLLLAYGRLLYECRKLEEAEHSIRQALSNFNEAGMGAHFETLQGYIVLGELLREKGALEDSETILKETLDKLKSIKFGFWYVSDQFVAECLNALGMTYLAKNRLMEARSAFAEGYELTQQKRSDVAFFHHYTLKTNLENVEAALFAAKPWYKRWFIKTTRKRQP